jgi:hypothetical protein
VESKVQDKRTKESVSGDNVFEDLLASLLVSHLPAIRQMPSEKDGTTRLSVVISYQ